MTLPKDVLRLLVEDYFDLRDALMCLASSRVFWFGRTVDESRIKFFMTHLQRKQKRYITDMKNNTRCLASGFDHANLRSCQNCRFQSIPQKKACKVCGAEEPTMFGSPHARLSRMHRVKKCPAELEKCPFKGLSFPKFFSGCCQQNETCAYIMSSHLLECAVRRCKICDEWVDGPNLSQHATRGCPAVCRYLGRFN